MAHLGIEDTLKLLPGIPYGSVYQTRKLSSLTASSYMLQPGETWSRTSCVGNDLICNVAEEGTRAGTLLEESMESFEWSDDST